MIKGLTKSIVKIYRATLSPMLYGLGLRCRFHPTCSEYAIQALERESLARAFILIFKRIIRCGPWHPGGIDPLPESNGSEA